MLKSWNAGSAWRENLCQGNQNSVSIDPSVQLKYYLSYLEVHAALCLGRWWEWKGGSVLLKCMRKCDLNSKYIRLTLTNTSHIWHLTYTLLLNFSCWELSQIWARSDLLYFNALSLSVISDHIDFVRLLSFSILAYVSHTSVLDTC